MMRQPSFRSLADGWLESVARFPDRTALVVGGQCLSYSALHLLVLRISAAIHQSELKPFLLAAVWAHRSLTAYAGILACLTAGKGYVPLNPKFPLDRTQRMLFHSRCSVLVVGSECVHQLSDLLRRVERPLTVILPEVTQRGSFEAEYPRHRFIFADQLPKGQDSPSSAPVSPASIAYLLFTSGSTGEPKGVPISQGNVRSYLDYACDRYAVTEQDRFSQLFDLTFDLSVHDMFVCWERGASLYCIPEKSAMAPAKFIRDHGLTMWFSVPSVAGLLLKMRLLSPGCFQSLRCSLFCGEPLPAAYAKSWQEAAPNSVVENLYGPTETTIAITHYRWERETSMRESVNGIVPVGRIFEGQYFRVSDPRGEAVSVGERGELCLSGSQVASGYWNDVMKTGEKFVRLPGTGERVWYRTGDLVKQNAAGDLCYLGRMDHQVKIRGYRVELQEIEAVLRRACGTEQVVSIPWPQKNGSAEGIVAFVSGVKKLDLDRVLACCARVLADYMVPKKIYLIEELPLNQNGKVDRGKLTQTLEGVPA